MKKIILSIIAVCMMAMTLVGCSKSDPATVSIVAPDGLPALSMANMMAEKDQIRDGYTVNYEVQKANDTLVAKIMNQEADIAIVPSTLAAQAYNKELGYALLGTATWGSFYLISSDDMAIENVTALTTTGKGLTPDIMLQYVLSNKGIDVNSLDITYLNAATELAPTFLSGQAKVVSVPEPMLSKILSKKPETKVIASINDGYKELNDSEYGFPQASIVVKKDFYDKNKKFVEEFLKKMDASAKTVYEDIEKTLKNATELELTVEVEAAMLERANIKYVAVSETIDEYNKYFEILNEVASDSIGGKVPDEKIFIEK